MLEGQRPGEPRHGCMGVWQPMADGRLTGDRRVYWHRGGTEDAGPWMYYFSSGGSWWVGLHKRHMQAGAAKGAMFVRSDAMLPEEIAEGAIWEGHDGQAWARV